MAEPHLERIRVEVRAVLAEHTSCAYIEDDLNGEEPATLRIETSRLEPFEVERLARALLRAAKIMRGARFVLLKCERCDATIDLEFSSGRIPEHLSLRHEPDGRMHGMVTWMEPHGGNLITAAMPEAARG